MKQLNLYKYPMSVIILFLSIIYAPLSSWAESEVSRFECQYRLLKGYPSITIEIQDKEDDKIYRTTCGRPEKKGTDLEIWICAATDVKLLNNKVNQELRFNDSVCTENLNINHFFHDNSIVQKGKLTLGDPNYLKDNLSQDMKIFFRKDKKL